MDQYDRLNKAQLSFEYLHTNSTTHTFLFGALAELVDNSRDAGARNLDIYTCKDPSMRGGFYVAFLDDGCGMHYDDVFNVIVFGKSAKRHAPDSTQIGQYGNGLKSGAMRVANDFILFTKKDNIGTCLFLSRSFHQEEHIAQVICPMPCFDLRTRQPVMNMDDQHSNGTSVYVFDQAKHDLEMRLITKYSPFKSIDELFKQFDLITSASGTLIILYNVKLLDTGEPELDIRTDPYDIMIDSKYRRNMFDDDDSTPVEYRSLRAYISILYYEPRMRVTIQRRRVITKKLPYALYKPKQYKFKSTRFKTRSEQEAKKVEKELETLEERIREADSQVQDAQQRLGPTMSLDERARLRKLQSNAAHLKETATSLRSGLARKKAEMHTTKTLTFIFGLNIQNRAADGVFLYNCGRLIRMYEKVGQPNKKTLYCRGVVGVVDIPSIVLEPTHNKQSFADEKEYVFLLKNMGEYMRQYWTDAGIENYVKEFWDMYGKTMELGQFDIYHVDHVAGYCDDQLDRPPSNEPSMVQNRQAAVPMLIQCDRCLKWRRLPYAGKGATPLTQGQLETWRCSDNPDVVHNSCLAPEKLEIIPEGELKPKPQKTTSRPVSPPPPSTLSTTRSSTTSKRVSNAEISSTTAGARSTASSRANLLPPPAPPAPSSSAQKRPITPSSRSASLKKKNNSKRQRPLSQQSKTTKSKSRSDNEEQESSEEDAEEDEEEEQEEEEKEEEEEERPSPATRRASTKSSDIVKKTQPTTRSSRSSTSIIRSDSSISSRSNNTQTTVATASDSVTSTNGVHPVETEEDNDEDIDDSDTSLSGYLPPPTIGARVSAMYQGARRSGKVLSVNDKQGRFKMRFDDFPSAQFDYIFRYKSPDWSYIGTPPVPAIGPSKQPETSTQIITSNDNELIGAIARKFKALIKFMLPPDWELTREQISAMGHDELSQFNVDVFMQSYREKMTKIVEQRKADEARWRTSAQRIQTEVTELLNKSGMPIPADCSMEDFERRLQDYKTRVDKQAPSSSS